LVAGVYALTSFTPLQLLIVLQNFAIIQQALPLLRLDGYYILSDLTGVPDIFQRIRPVLTSFIPGRPADERVTALKSWVRIVVSTYVLLIVAFLLLTVLALVINLPRIVATGYDSAALHYDAVGPAFSHGRALSGSLDLIQTLFLILPGAGLAYTAVRVIRRTGTGAYHWSAGHSSRQVALGLTGAAAVALAAFSWWPNGEYRPLQPGERGTLTGLAQQLAALPSGRPSLTVQRQQQLGGAPSERQRATQVVAPSSPGSHGHRSRANPVGAVSTAGATATTRSTRSRPTPFGATTPAPTTPPGAATTSTTAPSSPAVPGPQSTTSPQSTSSTATTSASTTTSAPPAGAQTPTTTSTPTP
jgi:putative peptide zinc metalloprotease protein